MILSGMSTFILIWSGQFVSLLGTAMTRFALLIWTYQQTGEATSLALLGFFAFGPYVCMSPLAGVWADRRDRRLVMLGADLGAGLATLGLLFLYATGQLQVWHLYLAAALAGASEAFQFPAYSVAITVLVPKQSYARANGLRSLAESASQVLGPVSAGIVLTWVGIAGVLWIDVATFIFATLTLLVVRIPRPALAPTTDSDTTPNSWWQELSVGFGYIFRRRGLLGLLLILMGINLFGTVTYYALLAPMVLARSGNDTFALASVQSALGIGSVVGGLLMSTWGGPQRRVRAILIGAGLSFLLGDFLFAIGRTVHIWSTAAFLSAVFIPMIIAANQTIWQAKVAPAIQGRVFAVQGMLRTAAMPLGYIIAGPLADQVFEPAMVPGGALADMCGWLVGTGPGAGMALLFLCTSLLGLAMSLSGYLFRSVRQVEEALPDHSPAGDTIKSHFC